MFSKLTRYLGAAVCVLGVCSVVPMFFERAAAQSGDFHRPFENEKQIVADRLRAFYSRAAEPVDFTGGAVIAEDVFELRHAVECRPAGAPGLLFGRRKHRQIDAHAHVQLAKSVPV